MEKAECYRHCGGRVSGSQLTDMLRSQLTRRNVDAKAMSVGNPRDYRQTLLR